MSKFSKPKTVREEDIERVIRGADAVDDRAEEREGDQKSAPVVQAAPAAPPAATFTMTLPGEMAGRVDAARKQAGGLTRLAWIRVAIAEKLTRDGM